MTNKYPKYYIVGDVYVMVDLDPKTNEVYAINQLGKPYPVYKPLYEGNQISKEEYTKGVKEVRTRLGVA